MQKQTDPEYVSSPFAPRARRPRRLVLILIMICCASTRAALLTVTVTEENSAASLPCRAWVEADGKRYYEPQEKNAIPYAKDRSFACTGRFTIDIPAGSATVHVERGKEYLPVDLNVPISDQKINEVTISLKRWTNMSDLHWYSTDLHVHFDHDDRRTLEQLAESDDLDWIPAITDWNKFNQDWPDTQPVEFGTTKRLITQNNQEIERIFGGPWHSVDALLLFGLKTPVSPERHDKTYPPSAALAEQAKEISPDCVIDMDKPLWCENVVGVALGLFDAVQVCHNHYQREKTMPLCCGMAEADIEDEKKEWGESELFHRTLSTYYRWLNCGFKLAATGGSAMGVMPSPIGYNRTYIKTDGPPNEENLLRAIRAGRTFATSGPMLILTVNRREVGSTIDCKTDDVLEIDAQLSSIQPLKALEMIHDGKVLHRMDLKGSKPNPVLKIGYAGALIAQRSGWLAARAMFESPTGQLRAAHTSPIYFDVDGKAAASRGDAEHMIRWIDKLLEISKEPDRYAAEADRQEAQTYFRKARAKYADIAETATQIWND